MHGDSLRRGPGLRLRLFQFGILFVLGLALRHDEDIESFELTVEGSEEGQIRKTRQTPGCTWNHLDCTSDVPLRFYARVNTSAAEGGTGGLQRHYCLRHMLNSFYQCSSSAVRAVPVSSEKELLAGSPKIPQAARRAAQLVRCCCLWALVNCQRVVG